MTPLGTTDIDLPPVTRSALEIVNEIRARKADAAARSGTGLNSPRFAEVM